jgi:transposase
MRPLGTPEELARRGQRAVAAYHKDQSPLTIARVLGVERSTVHRWVRLARQPGGVDPKSLQRPPLLSDRQLAELDGLLRQGATEHGWSSDLWTAARVAVLIDRHVGIRYHLEHVRKILKRRLGWSSQKPQKKAKERYEEGVRRWGSRRFPAAWRRASARRTSYSSTSRATS